MKEPLMTEHDESYRMIARFPSTGGGADTMHLGPVREYWGDAYDDLCDCMEALKAQGVDLSTCDYRMVADTGRAADLVAAFAEDTSEEPNP